MTRFYNRGFSLIELSIVLAILGLVSVTTFSVISSLNTVQSNKMAQHYLSQVEDALISFSKINHRLPCPDIDGDGYENCINLMTGAVPYHTIGMPLNTGVQDSDTGFQQIVYGVFVLPNAADFPLDADLTRLIERTDDDLGDQHYWDAGDFKRAIVNASKELVQKTQPYVTGDNVLTGLEVCDSVVGVPNANVFENAAFLLASPGAMDLDGDGSAFDSVNVGLSQDGNGSLCFASPSRIGDANYDDIVVGVSLNELLGYIN